MWSKQQGVINHWLRRQTDKKFPVIFSSIWILLVFISLISPTIQANKLSWTRRSEEKGRLYTGYVVLSTTYSTAPRTILREVSRVSSLILRAKLWLAKKVLRHGNRLAAWVRRRYFLERKKRRPEIRQRFAGYKKVRCKCKFVMFSLGFEKLSPCAKVKSGRIKVRQWNERFSEQKDVMQWTGVKLWATDQSVDMKVGNSRKMSLENWEELSSFFGIELLATQTQHEVWERQILLSFFRKGLVGVDKHQGYPTRI